MDSPTVDVVAAAKTAAAPRRKKATPAPDANGATAAPAQRKAPLRSTKNVYAFPLGTSAGEPQPAPADANESLILKLRVRTDVPLGIDAFNEAELDGFAGVEADSGGAAAGPGRYTPYVPAAADAMPAAPAHPQQAADADAGGSGEAAAAGAAAPPPQGALRVADLLKDFTEKTKNGEWPLSATLCCHWCCHRFDTQPFGLPVSYTGGVFQATGCFCSLGCASAYNADSCASADDVFERQALINLLSWKLGLGQRVRPAPPRLSLHMFGGHLSIDEFRALAQPGSGKVVTLNFPPMATLRQQIEEVNESDVASDLRYVPLDTDRINKYKERMRLQRKRPAQANQNTLDAVMQFTLGAHA